MSSQDNVERMQKIVAEVLKGNVRALLDRVHEEIEWNVPGPPNFPPYGQHRGKADFIATFQAMMESVEFDYFEPRQFFGTGDLTAMIVAERFKFLATDKAVEQESVITYRWKDEQIIEYHEYNDTAAIAAAFPPVS